MRFEWINTVLLFACSALAHGKGKGKGHDGPTGCPSPSPPTTIITSTTNLPASCTTRPTQTFYSSSGCALSCATDFCIRDEAVTIPCGCPHVSIIPTTITICPTSTPCYQCYTGWGTFFVTASCPSTKKPALATPTP